MDVDGELRRLAERQHGLVARRQALALGLSYRQIARRIGRGTWVAVSERVLRLDGTPRTELQAVMGAVLHHGPACWAARTTALALWGLPGFSVEPIHVVRRRQGRPRGDPTGLVHTTTDISDGHVATVDHIAVTTPVRAIFDIAGSAHPKRVERALDNAWARHLVSYRLLHDTLDELATRGRSGITLVRELADARPRSHRPPESGTEARLNDLLAADGQEPLRRQVDVGSDRRWLGRIDLRDTRLPLVVEVQSSLFHGSVLDQARDAERSADLRSAGFEVLELWEHQVWRSPGEAVRAVREARQAAATRSCGPIEPPAV
jgi:very-short-patch-repair endonuclease